MGFPTGRFRHSMGLLGALLAAACVGSAPQGSEPKRPVGLRGSVEARSPEREASLTGATTTPTIAGTNARSPTTAEYFGDGYPKPVAPAPHGRIGSLTWGTWIQPAPRAGSLPLGSIRPGDSLPVLSDELLPGNGKCPGFVAVEGGFVCAGPRATRDVNSRWLTAGLWTEPAPSVMPYQYALSLGAPLLTKPLPKERMQPWPTGARDIPRMKGWNAGHDELAEDEPIEPNGPIPDFLKDGGQVPTPWGEPKGVFMKKVPVGSMIAYTRAFEAFDETWVLTTDMGVIPARGLKRFRVSEFRGVELGHGVDLPIAWMRKQARPKWRRTDGGFVATGESWPLRSWVALTGKEERDGERRFLETLEPGVFIERSDATLVEKREKPPWETKGTGKWVHVRVNRGTLTAYEGPKPVFTTLMSPGKGEATPYGRYFVESKHHFTTMTTEQGEPTKFWIADVPWTVYFKRPYAIHAAYWHEDFGEKKSGGCVNLSPVDAKRVFDWIEPELPAGWDTVQARGVGGTFVLVEG